MDKIYWFLSACVIILIIIVLRAVLGKRMSAGLRYALWGLVLLRLLVPGTVFHSSFGVESMMQKAEKTAPVQSISAALSETEVYSGTMQDTLLSPQEAQTAHGGEIYKIQGYSVESGKDDLRTYFFRDSFGTVCTKLLPVIRYVGIAVTALIFAFSNLRLWFRLKRRRRRIESDCPLPVYAVENLSSSCLFGRAVYVSAETAGNETQLRHVLSHELSHYRHGDSLWALLRCCALALHWFNPLVWWAAILSRRDSELFADAGAVKALGEDAREDYGVTLIQLSARCAKNASLLCTATTMTSGKKTLTERVRGIAKHTRMTAAVVIAVVLIAALAVGCAFTGAKEEQRQFYPLELDIEVLEPVEDKILRSAELSVWDGDETKINELYGIYTQLLGNAETVPNEDVPLAFDPPIYALHFHDTELGENLTMQMWSSGLFLLDVTAHYNDHMATIYMAEDAEKYIDLFESVCTERNNIPTSVSICIPYSSDSGAYRIGYASDDIALKETFDAYIEMLRDRVPTEEQLGTALYSVSFELPDADPVSFFISGNGVAHFFGDETLYQVGRKYFTLFDTLFQKLEGHSSFPSFPSITVEYAFDNNVPERVAELSADYVRGEVEKYQQFGEAAGYQVEAAKIVGLTQMNTGTAGLSSSVNMYLLEYRIRVDHPENVVLAGGAWMDGDCITEGSSVGRPYLIFFTDRDDTVRQIGTTNEADIEEIYGTPEMLEKYGNPYTAACMEIYNEHFVASALENRDADTFLAWADTVKWERLSDDEFNTAFELLKEAALGNDMQSRVSRMLYAAAETDGAYSAIFFDTLLPMQHENDPDAFLAALNELPEEVYVKVGQNLPFIR